VSYVLVFRCPDSLVLDTAAGQAAKIIDHLDRYLIRDAWGISYSKGCYLGQETLARIASEGRDYWNCRLFFPRLRVGLVSQTRRRDVPWRIFRPDRSL
jgi:folate-binding Fe-S cluster repair protein YgfZ